ncbi:hypothetical protein ACJ41O_013681 [Fusarium nematophilum]
MPSVHTLLAAIVAGLAIGTHAGPCRPHSSYPPYGQSSSVAQAGVTTTTYPEPPIKTSSAYPDNSGATAAETTAGETSAGETPAEETTAAETTSLGGSTYTLRDTTTLDVTTTKAATRPPRPDEDATTAEETTSAETTTAAQDPTTALDTATTGAPTSLITSVKPTTSSLPPDTTSEAPTTTSEASSSTSTCPPRAELSCGNTGFFPGTDWEGHRLRAVRDTELEACKTLCLNNPRCVAIGFFDYDLCELFDVPISELELQEEEDWYYSVYDRCCFE